LPYRAEQRMMLNASPAEVWELLTRPELIGEWFADCSYFAPGEQFVFDFGDGDYFAGRVVGFEPPSSLHLKWKFLGIGPEFDIVYHLRASGDGTELIVSDTGSLTREEAEGLTEGWKDFLSRLEARIATGSPARYRWSQTIGVGALTERAPEDVRASIGDQEWLKNAFAGSTARKLPDEDGQIRLRFARDAWRGRQTEATVSVSDIDGKTYIGVVHGGWTELAEPLQIAERARFAALWREALASLESDVAASRV
jgi:uncharacterized protein YndB with AHSA1/START domain